MATFMTNNTPQHTEDRLDALPPYLQSETHLTAHLASRFHLNLPTAKLSSHGIVCFNNYTSSTRGPDGSKEGSAMAAAEDLASRAWTRLGARGENQAVVFLGESGSGKTTVRSHFLSSILSMSGTPLSTKLSYAAFLFDSLTTTKSITTPTASKAGLFYELQYDTTSSSHPTLIGGKLLGHRLERRRLASVPIGERSFHIMYYLLAGTSAAEKHHLGLEESSHHNPAEAITHGFGHGSSQKRWRYLGHPTQLKVGINDAEGFQQFKMALRSLEFPRNDIAEICQVLATVMHIGQLEFVTIESTAPAPDESGGYSHEGGEAITVVKNRDTLTTIAAFLGVSVNDLETSLSYKTQTLHRERVTIMLDPKGARKNADELAQTLYSLLVSYLLEQVNEKVCALEDGIGNTVSVVDFPGFAQSSSTTGSTLDQLLNNAATESLYQLTLKSFYEQQIEIMEAEEVPMAPTSYFDNSDAVKGLLKKGNGLLSILDDQMRRGRTDIQFLEALRNRFENKNPAIEVSEAFSKLPGSNFASANDRASFTVKHFAGEVEYPVAGLLEDNADVVSGDVVNLVQSSRSDFVRAIFGQEALQTVHHAQERTAVVQATLSSKPSRKPSVAKRRGSVKPLKSRASRSLEDTSEDGSKPTNPFRNREAAPAKTFQGAAGEFLSSLSTITEALSTPNTNAYTVFCLKPNDRRIANQFDSKCVRSQLQTFGIAEMSQRLKTVDFSVFLPFGEFLGLAEPEDFFVGSEHEKAERVIADRHWPENEARAGSTGVLLSERCWAEVSNVGRGVFPQSRYKDTSMDYDEAGGSSTPIPRLRGNDSRLHLLGTPSPAYHDEKSPGYFARELDARSDTGTAFVTGDMFRNLDTREELAEKGNQKKMEEVDDIVVSGSRKRWVFLVWLMTFFVPDFAIRKLGGIKRKDIRMAWREKLAINLLIWCSCGFMVFFIVFFPKLICPHQYVYSSEELSSYDGKKGDAYVGIRGVVFDLSNFLQAHQPSIIPDSALLKYAGKDATSLFPIQVSAMCQGVSGSIDPAVQISYQSANYSSKTTSSSSSDPNARYHDFRWATGANNYRPTWFTEQMLFMESGYYKGLMGFPPSYLKTLASTDNYIGYINGRVYDLTSYVRGAVPPQYPPGQNGSSSLPDSSFMDQSLVGLFTNSAGGDLTQQWLKLDMDQDLRERMQLCLDNLYFVGKLDTRNSAKCQFAQYFSLAISILLVSVIGFKFLAALQFGGNSMPENLDRFVMITIPAYTEGLSLSRAIDSAAKMQYDDKRKLLVIICDGMVMGQGEEKPTPRIVLDYLGVPADVDPEPLSFESLGEGQKQHNMGKVYSGLYEVAGHVVPFLVVVKIGKPSEVSRPGNRGKRDSQMVMMRFLNRVHYNLAMSPLELEMHHQIRNIIGVNPAFYEYLLQIDADTVVAPDSATRFVAAFLHDTRLLGVCGETALSNAKHSVVTMIQVYEYFISHNLTKAFESLFGCVTCLPGCFTMVRIFAADTGKPLFVSKEVVEEYSEIRVDTLHVKNLLHLGEDRYLTTLLLKHHPSYKTKYIFKAQAWTVAPDSWKVFFSQRRRWINSTVHNLVELVPLQQLCGFFCFSMRFVVLLDLLSTLVQPVIVGYICYLIYLVISNPTLVPVTSFILIGAIYGLQAIIFILRRRWEMLAWMIIYILATPVFACILPLISFWQMDDFSWGNTRVVTGEGGRQVVVSDEGKFDPASIPKKKWEEYQAELLEAQENGYEHEGGDNWIGSQTGGLQDDVRSQHSAGTYATKSVFGFGGNGAGRDGGYRAPPTETWQDPSAPMSHRISNALSLLHPAGIAQQPPEYDNAPSSYGYLPASRPLSTFEMADMQQQQQQQQQRQSRYLSSRPVSTLMPYEMTGSNLNQPSDDALLQGIKEIVATADLMTVTKKSVRVGLETRFGLPQGSLEGRKAYIGSATEAVLGGQL